MLLTAMEEYMHKILKQGKVNTWEHKYKCRKIYITYKQKDKRSNTFIGKTGKHNKIYRNMNVIKCLVS